MVVPLLLLLLVVGASAADFSGNEATFLPAHNQVRCGWGSAPVTYSAALEQSALAWAQTCPTAASPHDPNTSEGENVFLLNPGSNPPYTGDVVTQIWAAEASLWACAVDRCADTVTGCLHFRQIVWSATSQIGCAAVDNCPGEFPVVYVCRYLPPGNIAGQHPLADPLLQCPLNGGGSCSGTTSSSSSTTSSTSSSSTTTTTTGSPTTSPPPTFTPTYPPSCSAEPEVVKVVRPPQTSVRFSFKGMMDGVCQDQQPTSTPTPCPQPCSGPQQPVEVRHAVERLLL